MKPLLVTCLALTVASPSLAQEDETGLGLMERGVQLFLDGLLKEVEPALDGIEGLGPKMRDFAAEFGPAMTGILSQIEDWSTYHPPEILPNGDIILRRKQPQTPGFRDEPLSEDAPIDL